MLFAFHCLQPTHLANFNQVQSIQYSAMEEKDRKGMLQLNVAGAAEVLLNLLSLAFYALFHWHVVYSLSKLDFKFI